MTHDGSPADPRKTLKRGDVWALKLARPAPSDVIAAVILQSNALNVQGHATTIVVPASSHLYDDGAGDAFPLRVRISRRHKLTFDVDLLLDQIRALPTSAIQGSGPLCTLTDYQLLRVTEALRLITE